MAKRKTKSYRQLIEVVATSSGYHQYEVEDVLRHLLGNIQILLAEGTPVKLAGLGTLRVKKMKIRDAPDGRGSTMCYDTYRLSVTSDTSMRNYLKENHVETE